MKIDKKIFTDNKTRDAFLAGLLIVLVVIFAVVIGIRGAGSPRIFSVDMERIMGEHPAFHTAMEEFQQELDAMQQRLEQIPDEEKLMEQQRMQQQIQQLAMRIQNEAFLKVMEDVERIAGRRGYRYILDEKAVITGGRDVTEEILAEIRGEVPLPPVEDERVDPSVMPMIPVR